MALPNDFPISPYTILDPNKRWFPDKKTLKKDYLLIPPLVYKIRHKVKEWRDSNYLGATETTKNLLHFWFEQDHWIQKSEGMVNFKYYFAQREAVETVIYLHEIVKVKDKHDLLQFDNSGLVSEKDFTETWSRFVIKMATGSGKTKVLSLILVWSYFNKTYETDSNLSRNFLVITPNIIVLDRILSDFDGLKIFFKDPMLPDNGYCGHNWRSDFQLKLHVQDNVHMLNKNGNIFLTNIHRVYDSRYKEPSFADENTINYFLGEKAKNIKEEHVDLGNIVRDIDELLVLNDEAHHIHDTSLQWFKSIEDIHNNLKHKKSGVSLQVDFTATPKNTKGFIFPQTVVDYPLVEAIHQNIVKQPYLPDEESRKNIKEKESYKIEEKYEDHLHVGYLEWKKAYEEHIKLGKKAVLFVMVEDTKKCDAVARYLENNYYEFKGSVLTIHTKTNGELKDKNKEDKTHLEELRKAANEIDRLDNPYKVIVSVLVLKEGWDVKNVTTIVGLRSFNSKSKILPEQTLGRGLRKMYPDIKEKLMIIGTEAFMDFVEKIKSEGVELGECSMGVPSEKSPAIIIEVDENKDLNKLDIGIPIMGPTFYKDFKKLRNLDVSQFGSEKFKLKKFNVEEQRSINFKHITTNKKDHTLILTDRDKIDYRSMLKFFTEVILDEARYSFGSSTVYEKLKEYITNYLFNEKVDLNNPNVLKNLSDVKVKNFLIETFVYYISNLTTSSITPKIKDIKSIRDTRPFIVSEQAYLVPKKSVFNKIIGDSHLELRFAEALENFNDVISYTKIYPKLDFFVDYQNKNGSISKYYPDFLVKTKENEIYVVETKGMVDLNVPLKLKRLKKWCLDVNTQQEIIYKPLYVEERKFNTHKYHSFKEIVNIFKEDINYLIKDYEK
ncbi:MAG: DEAD/DEAH box helicase family protein [archaeon]|nr:DEAD/DEAH box helicase family protein [archaeon]